MERREALELLPELSADCLDEKTAQAVRQWIDDCPECKMEWSALHTMMEQLSTASQPLLSSAQSQRMWANCAEKIFDRVEAERLAKQNPSLWAWMKMQPRWGWAMVGGAVVVLGAAWMANPEIPAAQNGDGAPALVAEADPGELRVLSQPPSYAATMVDHHAQMAIDPFSDHVGSSLVSYAASAPQN